MQSLSREALCQQRQEVANGPVGGQLFVRGVNQPIDGLGIEGVGELALQSRRRCFESVTRCPSETAFHERLSAAQRHKMPVFAMAWALVHLANGGENSAHTCADAQLAAGDEWGQLLAGSAGVGRLRLTAKIGM
jgi:hypothetical protein